MSAADAYAVAFRATGQQATFTRSATTATVWVRGYGSSAEKIVGMVEQDKMRLICLAADFGALTAPQRGDRVSFAGATRAVVDVDPVTRSLNGTVLAYVVEVKG